MECELLPVEYRRNSARSHPCGFSEATIGEAFSSGCGIMKMPFFAEIVMEEAYVIS